MKFSMENFFHKYQIIRRIIIAYTLWLTAFVYQETFELIEQYPEMSMDLAATVAAILGPVSLLLAFVTKIYAEHPYKDKEKFDKEEVKEIIHAEDSQLDILQKIL